jgi:flagellum-specific peptidoglycan hydrolase FlgJ
LNVLSSGITLLSKAITTLIPLIEVTLVAAFRGLIAVLTGPMGLILLLGGALFAARKLFDQNQEEYLKLAKEKKEKGSLSEKDEARLKQLETPVNREKARQELKYDPTTGKAVSDEEAKKTKDQVNKDTQTSYKRIEEAAFIQLANEWEQGGKKDPLLNPNDSRNVTRRTKELISQGYVPKDMPADVKVEGSGAPSVLPNETAGGAAVGLYPTPGMQKTPGLNHGGRTTQKLVGGGVDDERLIKPDAPKPASYSNEGKTRPTPALSSTGAYRGQRSDMSTSPSQVTSTSSQVAAYGGYKSRQDFTDAMMPYAQKAATELKVSPEAIIAQWGLETGFGRAGAVQGQFNYGNIQGTYRESEPGLDSGRARNFIKYNSMDDFVDDYVKQLKNPRYAKQGIGQEQLGDREFFTALKKGGYAEDPNYVNTLTALAEKQRGIKPGAPGEVPTYEKPATAFAQNNPPAKLPPSPLATLMASMPNAGSLLGSLTGGYEDMLRSLTERLAPNITNVTNNTVASGGGNQQGTPSIPSAFDDAFLNLLERAA